MARKQRKKLLVVDSTGKLFRQVSSLGLSQSLQAVWEPRLDRVLDHFETMSFDLLLIEGGAIKPATIDTVDLLALLHEKSPSTQSIMLVEPRDVRLAMLALKGSLFQYGMLPIGDEELGLLLETALEKQPSYGVNLLLRKAEPAAQFEEIIGRAPPMQELYRQVRQAAATDIPVLISGETGTGKDLVARAIHKQSVRAQGSYLPVHLAAMPSELVASELFGHEKGAFTGAVRGHKGKFELANDGTIFIDEIGTIDERVQISLLRIIEEKRFTRLGGRKTLSTNARIIAATNENMREAVRRGAFREDLFYRLDVFHIEVSPLRQRSSDVPRLLEEFLRRYNQQLQKNIRGVAPDLMNLLTAYEWPGNVRELKNVIHRAALVCTGDILLPEHLPPRFQVRPKAQPGNVVLEPGTTLEEAERQLILHALSAARNRKEAAQLLGISRRALYNKLAKHRIT